LAQLISISAGTLHITDKDGMIEPRMESDMKKLILAAALIGGFSASALAETDGEYIIRDDSSSSNYIVKDNSVQTAPLAIGGPSSDGCDQAAGASSAPERCDAPGLDTRGGSNSGGQSR
jgi:hypothetical protein